MIQKLLFRLRWFPSHLYNLVLFRLQHVHVQYFPHTYGCVFVRNWGVIQIGNHVTLHSSLNANPLSGMAQTILVTKTTGNIRIGDHTGISNAVLYSASGIYIGAHVMIGSGTRIYDGDFHPLDAQERRLPGTQGSSAPVHIEDDVFIGSNCLILKGVRIGSCSVIGAGSVVTKSVPTGQIWGGNPARFLRTVA